MVHLHQHVHGLALYVEVGVLQEPRHRRQIDRGAPFRERAERRAADHLVRILELDLQRLADFRTVEFAEQVDQVHFHDRVLAAHAGHQVRHHLRFDHRFDDLEQRRLFLDVELVGALQQLVHRQIVFVDLQDFDQCGLRDFPVVEEREQRIGVVVG